MIGDAGRTFAFAHLMLSVPLSDWLISREDDAIRLDDALRRGFNILISLAIEEVCRLM
jgi:hypothetical protein